MTELKLDELNEHEKYVQKIGLTNEEYEHAEKAYRAAELVLDHNELCTQDDVLLAQKHDMLEWNVDCDVRGLLAGPTWKFLRFMERAFSGEAEAEAGEAYE